MSIYFIRSNGFVKIGIACDPEKRAQTINTDAPCGAELVTTISPKNDTDGKLEKLLHAYYSEFNHRAEWFVLPKREVAGFVLTDTVSCDSLENVVKSISAKESVEEKKPLTARLAEQES